MTISPSPAQSHPRLFFTPDRVDQARQALDLDPIAQAVLERIEAAARRTLAAPPLERTLEGRRLLKVSRMALARVARLCLFFHLTGESVWANRIRQEVEAVLAFSDWNPNHFLDTAEMAVAVAVALDSLYDILPVETRARWQQGLVRQALEPSIETPDRPNPWITRKNNWGQVCHGGLTLAALAIADDHPEWLDRIIPRAVEHLPAVLETYAPDGAYPEGPTYWRYGTTFHVLFLEAVRNSLGTTFGLEKTEGFAESARYLVKVRTPSGLYWNYADSGRGGIDDGVLLWMAETFGMPDVARAWINHIQPWLSGPLPPDQEDSEQGFPQLLPFYLLWWPTPPSPAPDLSEHSPAWIGQGSNPIAVFNESNGPAGPFFAGIKGGCGTTSHAHLDAGSFCLELGGVRWAVDPMRDAYERLEAAGIRLWDFSQDAERWDLVAYGHEGHGILTLNGERPRVDGMATLTRRNPEPGEAFRVVVDLAPCLGPAVHEATRTLVVTDDRTVRLVDRLVPAKADARFARWRWITRAAVGPTGHQAFRLSQDGHRFGLSFSGSAVATPGWRSQTIPLDTLKQPFEVRTPAETALDVRWDLVVGEPSTLTTECQLIE
ncbi:MAG: heparinase II/III domain-containing protein [Opitutales bacterium]